MPSVPASPPRACVPRALRLLAIRGVIARRVLVNFRVAPDVAARLVPPPFRPRLVRGRAVAGVCLIRLERLRPAFVPAIVPAVLRLASENAAHRIAVEWGEAGSRREGVFIPRRDTDSLVHRLVGGRLFPGVHHPARFRVREEEDRIELEMSSRDGQVSLSLEARATGRWPGGSVFESLEEASAFFRAGACGWSPRPCGDGWDGLHLRTRDWRVEPLSVERVRSSFFESAGSFPSGSVELDGALLMRNIDHEWMPLRTMPSGGPQSTPSCEGRERRRGGGRGTPRRSRSAFFDLP